MTAISFLKILLSSYIAGVLIGMFMCFFDLLMTYKSKQYNLDNAWYKKQMKSILLIGLKLPYITYKDIKNGCKKRRQN